ncbi:MAG TPA: sugar phosphate nucleotidyltransferase [Candidatus Limnocylindrales bacterium]|nr:sugar phosphate nucleotidyltransferase [Candidatus Limnocylindrales bacterium]
MKAVVMAGGEGSRLRPLTSGLPKPLVPVVGKPIMEHILRLLREQGIEEVIVTLQYLGSAIRDYFGDGSDFGMDITYVVEDAPLGTAGSVKNAQSHLQEPFIVISGDALTDIDLGRAVEFHREHGALATIVLTSVPTPLEYGVVITGPDGAVQRFLEKPSWGEVFSDQVNTGIYVLDPRVLDLVAADRVVDWSADIFPAMLARRMPLFGYLAPGYWCDIGNLQTYYQANWDALAGRVAVEIAGQRRDGDIWVGEDVELGHDVRLQGPAYIGREAKIKAGVFLNGPVCVGNFSVIDENTKVSNSVIWNYSYIGENSRLRQAIVCGHVTVKNNSLLEEGSVIGDGVSIGEGSTIYAGVKIWPDKDIEPGSLVHESIIWAGHWKRGLFSSYGLTGLVNIELTPEYSARLGASFAALFPKGAAIAAARDSQRPSRMIKRAMVSGMMSAGASIIDLSELPIPAAQYYAQTHELAGAVHIQMSPLDRRSADIRMFDHTGVILDKRTERKLENIFYREDIRRVHFYEMGSITYPRDAIDSYLDGILGRLDIERIRQAGFKVLVDFDHGSGSLVLPRAFKELNVDSVPLNAGFDESYQPKTAEAFEHSLGEAALITRTLGCHLGAYIDYGAERFFVIDDQGNLLDHHAAFGVLILLSLQDAQGIVVAPATAPRAIERLVERCGGRFVPSKAEPSALLRTAEQHQAKLASDGKGGYVFPEHQLAFDATFALMTLLQFLARDGRPLSQIRTELPEGAYQERLLSCPWDAKGRVMRTMVEMHREQAVDLADGIKIFVEGGWVLVLPDPDLPQYHVIVSVDDQEQARLLADRYGRLVAEAVSESGPANAPIPA